MEFKADAATSKTTAFLDDSRTILEFKAEYLLLVMEISFMTVEPYWNLKIAAPHHGPATCT